VTLAFLNDVREPASLHDGLRTAAAAMTPFQLELAGSGVFRGARATWAGVDGDVPALTGLADRVHRACREAGVVLDERPFRPHLTVGKTKRLDPSALSGYRGPTWAVREIELVQSVLGKAAAHTVLDRFPLYQA
jgi:2'-5' RNA ligase